MPVGLIATVGVWVCVCVRGCVCVCMCLCVCVHNYINQAYKIIHVQTYIHFTCVLKP